MTPYYTDDAVTLFHGDCLEVLASLPDCSVDSVVTDPPYGLGFMGREWDDLPPGVEFATECLRVLKPGGHLLAFGGSRTWHRLTCAIEDAGFEIRDSIAWLYGSGFPKSLDVSKAIDKRPGVGRHAEFGAMLRDAMTAKGYTNTFDVAEVVTGRRTGAVANWIKYQFPEAKWWPSLRDLLDLDDDVWGPVIAEADREVTGQHSSRHWTPAGAEASDATEQRDKPTTPDAQRWQGWGTALKPAFEPIVVARKPLAGTVAANVLAYGTGALNVDGCRVGTEDVLSFGSRHIGTANGIYGKQEPKGQGEQNPAGRWPSNVVLDDTQAAELDKSGDRKPGGRSVSYGGSGYEGGWGPSDTSPDHKKVDSDARVSRFFPVFTNNQQEEPCSQQTTEDSTNVATSAGSQSKLTTGRTPEVGESTTTQSTSNFPTFKYEPKAPTSERPRVYVPGCNCETRGGLSMDGAAPATLPRLSATSVCGECGTPARGESHATVKPLDLMRWLVRLVTPPGGTVLEPFAGSGTTAEACVVEGFKCVAIEREADYLPLIVQRLSKPIQVALDFD